MGTRPVGCRLPLLPPPPIGCLLPCVVFPRPYDFLPPRSSPSSFHLPSDRSGLIRSISFGFSVSTAEFSYCRPVFKWVHFYENDDVSFNARETLFTLPWRGSARGFLECSTVELAASRGNCSFAVTIARVARTRPAVIHTCQEHYLTYFVGRSSVSVRPRRGTSALSSVCFSLHRVCGSGARQTAPLSDVGG